MIFHIITETRDDFRLLGWLFSETRIPGASCFVSLIVRSEGDGRKTKDRHMRTMKQALVLSAVAAGLALTGAGVASADAGAAGVAANSPGFLSGNLIQVPVHVPINICGDSVNVIALLNPAFGNTCVNS
jgi:hypothetical protein